MIGCLRTRVRKQPIIALYFYSENELKFFNLEARTVRAGIQHKIQDLHVLTAKIQIRLHSPIRILFFRLNKLGPLATHSAPTEYSNQTAQMPRLIGVSDGRTCQLVTFFLDTGRSL